MKKLLEHKIRESEMLIRFFNDILIRDCEELRRCVVEDLGYKTFEDIDKNILFSGEAREVYWKLNSGHSKTRNWLILNNLEKYDKR